MSERPTTFEDHDGSREPFQPGDVVRLIPWLRQVHGTDQTARVRACRWSEAEGWSVQVDGIPIGSSSYDEWLAGALELAAPTFDTEIATLFLGGA